MIHLYFFLVGAILASFLGLVIDRFPEQSIIFPASHCDSCETRLRPLDLIPIVSHRYSIAFAVAIASQAILSGMPSLSCLWDCSF